MDDSHPDTATSHEANKQKIAHSCGLPVPKIFELTTVEGKQAIIMEFIKGKTLGDMLVENREDAEYYMNLSIDIQQNIHTITADKLESMAAKLSRQKAKKVSC